MIKRLKKKWEIESNFQFWMIMLVFSITGSSLRWIVSPILGQMGIGHETAWAIHIPMYILVAYPSYQIMLMVWGSLLGQFQFFWAFEKKMLRRFGFKNL
jgi:hypothetical protein